MEQQQSNEIRAEFKMEQQQNARIEWVDVFRGLLIISMVLGHSTGLFNNFIYQFHMAGFLFISGYTTQQSKRNVLETVFYRFFTLLLPLIVAFFGLLALTKGMEAANIYSIFFSADLPPLSFTETIKQFFLHGSIYVWWLGACWFLIILFFVSCIHRLFFSFFREKYDFKYLLFSLCLLLIGYYMARNHMKSAQLDLVLIAQFYFFIGLWFKDNRYIEKLPNKQIFYVISTICSIGILYFFAYIVPVTVDYPSRRFGMPWLDFFVAINGIFAFFLLSKFAIKIHASKPLMYLGRKTLPIMMFHFMFFNVAYFILYLFQVVPLDYLQNFTATNEIGNQFWWLIAGVSILCSLLLWKVLQSFEVGRILFGQKSTLYNQIYQKIGTSRVVTQIEKAISFVKLPFWQF